MGVANSAMRPRTKSSVPQKARRSACASCLVRCRLTMANLPPRRFVVRGRSLAGATVRLEPMTRTRSAFSACAKARATSSGGRLSPKLMIVSCRAPPQRAARHRRPVSCARPMLEPCTEKSRRYSRRQTEQYSMLPLPCSSDKLALGTPLLRCKPSTFWEMMWCTRPCRRSSASAMCVGVGSIVAMSTPRMRCASPFACKVHMPSGPR
mmetsp:Transcript_40958/g.115853  ORF Transcript_40958/g.115853 Transcript_40958/m.115853 type:complete len:208 (-) Transcript_40958:223-846(-)